MVTVEFEWVKTWWSDFHRKHTEFLEDQAFDTLFTRFTDMQVSIPHEYLCPITRTLLRHPAVASDGFTYEERAIQEWIQREERSPMTNQPLSSPHVYPNHALRHVLTRFYETIKDVQT